MVLYIPNVTKAMFTQMRKAIAIVIVIAFIGTSIKSPAYGQMVDPMPRLSVPGVMVHLSPEFTPAYLKGIVIHPDNALKFDFIIYKGDKRLTDSQKKAEYTKLTKYFLASLAIPDDDQWVNLSPYEKGRIIPKTFGLTEMGRDLLAEDYMLKQITASLIYPEDNLGKKFWDRVYSKAQQQYGTTNIQVNTFNKVWIIPDDALIYEKSNTAYVLRNHLRVMLEQDYLALQKQLPLTPSLTKEGESSKISPLFYKEGTKGSSKDINTLSSQIVREIILPALQKEVNEGKNFAALRQIYSGMILATWYKRAIKESLLSKIYANKAKVKGIDQDPKTNEEIYRQYLRAYKKGVFNFIKEDLDKYTNETIPRKYFSGGVVGSYAQAAREFGRPILITRTTISPPDNATLIGGLQREEYDYAQIVAEESIKGPTEYALRMNEVKLDGGKEVSIEYTGPITLNLAGKLELEIMKVDELDPGLRSRINPKIGFVIVDVKGGVKALRDTEVVPLGRSHSYRFQDLDANNPRYDPKYKEISGGHITISRKGDRITLQDGVGGRPSMNGTSVIYTEMVAEQQGDVNPVGSGNNLTPAFKTVPKGKDSANQDAGYADPERGIFLVADGMGGHKAGEVASRIARETVDRLLTRQTIAFFKSIEEVKEYLARVVMEADQAILDYVSQHPETRGMGTTFSFGLIWKDPLTGKTLLIGVNKGDSRIYVRKINGSVIQLSRDDSPVQMGVDSGAITPEQAEVHLTRNVINDFLGRPGNKGRLESHQIIVYELQDGEVALAVSDGISDNLGRRYIDRIAQNSPDAQGMAQALIDEAVRISTNPQNDYEKARRKPDDMTVAALGVGRQDGGQGAETKTNFEIGQEFGAHGHKIDGGVSTGRDVGREVIVVDFKRDMNLMKMYQRIKQAMQTKYSEYDLTNLPGRIKGDLLKEIYEEIKDKVKYDDMASNYKKGDVILVGEAIEKGGVCRHMGIIAAAIIEKFILEGILSGKVYYVRGSAHGWAVYKTSGGESIFFDVAQQQAGYHGLGMQYFGGNGLARYTLALKQVEALEEEAKLGATKGGIDLNSANLNLQIKRDGKGVPLSISQQDLENIHIDGLIPVILGIKPATATPLLSELQSSQTPQLASIL